MRVSILLYKVSNIKLFIFLFLLDLALQGFTTFKKILCKELAAVLGINSLHSKRILLKHPNIKVIRSRLSQLSSEHHSSWLFQNQKLIMVWVGGDCGIAHTQRIVH